MKTSLVARQAPLRYLLGSALAASALIASGNVSASPVITGFQLLDGTAGTLDSAMVNNLLNTVDISKSFETVNPMTMRLTVGHGTGSGGPFAFTETINNMTGKEWSDYHISLANAPNGVGFNNFANSTMGGFTLDPAPASGSDKLNFTGSLAAAATGTANFLLSLTDPGNGNSYTLDITQTPTTAAVPIPMAGWLFGSGLMALGGALRRKVEA
ncbi:MAG: hypothetical protein HY749_00770 [Gammaproteobacteria bacterium]|nr:hypothetical protein [Gammaproteobacteria bacterium]MBI5616565.1 hypothetical protein [Gammaproteobacteria bacterium]